MRVVKLSTELPKTAAGRHIAMQVVRSGTSPAPNYAEGPPLPPSGTRPGTLHRDTHARVSAHTVRRRRENESRSKLARDLRFRRSRATLQYRGSVAGQCGGAGFETCDLWNQAEGLATPGVLFEAQASMRAALDGHLWSETTRVSDRCSVGARQSCRGTCSPPET